MTWLQRLAAELTARGVPSRQQGRIGAELRDHIECEPGCEDRLGEPRELAITFADELATAGVRSSAFQAFGALTLAAVALALSQLAIGSAGGYPGFDRGISMLLFVPALVGMFIAPQVALVAGTLAALRSARRRRSPRLPAAEIGLIGRRARVALWAGFATVAGLELYVANFSLRLPTWYLSLVGGSAAVAGAALFAAARSLTRARAIVSSSVGAAGDVYDDLPLVGWRWLRRRPWRLGAAGALLVGFVMTAFEAHAERSLSEGLQRGIAEGLIAAAGFALLGRAVGLVPDRSARLLSMDSTAGLALGTGLAECPGDQLAADEDRARAEVILREGFAHGRLGLDELTTRVSAVHDARTVGQLRDALTGLPPGPRAGG